MHDVHSWATCVALLYSGITKLANTSAKATVYRGVSEETIKLPDEFVNPSASSRGFAGGVEMASFSTTTERHVAESYAGAGEHSSIFEITFDQANRGADLKFLSQYPHEDEILFPPGTSLTCAAAGSNTVLLLRAVPQQLAPIAALWGRALGPLLMAFCLPGRQ